MDSIRIDEKVPNFILEDFNGNTFTLSDCINKKNVFLVLNRGLS